VYAILAGAYLIAFGTSLAFLLVVARKITRLEHEVGGLFEGIEVAPTPAVELVRLPTKGEHTSRAGS
jgi:hypothetical protein